MPDLFGRYSLPNVLGRLFGHGTNDPSHYTLPSVLGRLFHHGQTPPSDPYALSGGGNLPGGQMPFQPYTFGMNNIGPPQIGQSTGNGLDGTIPMQPTDFHMRNIGPPQIGGGGGGPSQSTGGFTTAFRGGGEVYDPADYLRALRTKGGEATQ